jgi:hypothetical protein
VQAVDAGASADAGSGLSPRGMSFGGGEGPYFEQVDRDYDSILESTRTFAEFFCECETTGSADPQYDACVESYLVPHPPPVLYCSKEVYSQSAEAAAALECQRKIVDAYIACVLRSTCFDFDNITQCEVDRILMDIECEDVPYLVWAKEQEQCLGLTLPPAFECKDGEFIDPDWVCDFEDDCADASDETGCDPHAGL